jgi:hypothetical protein
MKNEKNFKKRISEIASSIAKEEIGPGQSRVQNKPPFKNIIYKGVKLDASLNDRAMKLTSMMSQDLQDPVKSASISKVAVPSDQGFKGGAIVFKIEFATKGTFFGMVKTDPTDSRPSTSPLNPTDVDYAKMTKNMSPDQIKGLNKDMDLYKDKTIYKGKYSLKEDASADYLARTGTKATFVGADGTRKDLDNVPELKSDTKGAAKKLLYSIATDASTLEEKDEFEEKISELAAKIAGVNEEYESDKINLPDSIKARINSAIANQKDMAQFILDMMEEIISKEPGMADIQNKSGWNSVSAQLKRLAGVSSSNDNSNVSKEPSDMDFDALKESYNRIKRN